MNYVVLLILIVSTSFILGANQALIKIPATRNTQPSVLSITDIPIPTLLPTISPLPSIPITPSVTLAPSATTFSNAKATTQNGQSICTVTVNGQTVTKTGTDCTIDQTTTSNGGSVTTSTNASATTGGNTQSN